MLKNFVNPQIETGQIELAFPVMKGAFTINITKLFICPTGDFMTAGRAFPYLLRLHVFQFGFIYR
jgi:hypothetical protein